jgi:hypothetical protein
VDVVVRALLESSALEQFVSELSSVLAEQCWPAAQGTSGYSQEERPQVLLAGRGLSVGDAPTFSALLEAEAMEQVRVLQKLCAHQPLYERVQELCAGDADLQAVLVAVAMHRGR